MIKEIEKDLLKLEDQVFRGGDFNITLKSSVDYRREIIEDKINKISFIERILNKRKLEEIRVRLLCLRSL